MMTVVFQISGEMMNSVNGVGTTRQPSGRKIKLEPYFTPFTKINSRWIKRLNLNVIIKVLEENETTFYYPRIRKIFLNTTQNSEAIKDL